MKNRANPNLFFGVAILAIILAATFHFARDIIFPEAITSPNLRSNGFLFIHARDNPQLLEKYRIENDGRYTYIGRIHHTERQSILEKHFAPVQP